MKIAIMGQSGCGKSTLAQFLSRKLDLPLLHLDCVHWLPGWVERDRTESAAMVAQFMDAHDSWVIDGNYTRLCRERRLEEADRIIIMIFPRLVCLYRIIKRRMTFAGQTRSSITEGCPEKIDAEFLWWILWKGRDRKHREGYRSAMELYSEKITLLKNQRDLDRFMEEFE